MTGIISDIYAWQDNLMAGVGFCTRIESNRKLTQYAYNVFKS